MQNIKLFKKSSNGTDLVWTAVVDGNKVTYSAGQVGGKMQTKTDIYTVGKAGRTPEQQAALECLSTAKKKQDKGYALSIEEQGTPIPRPTLAQEFSKYKHKLDDMIWINPKLDGFRMVGDTHTGKLWSRNGKEFVGTPHINKAVLALRPLADELGIRFVDGEAYRHGLSWEELSHLVMQKKSPVKGHEEVEYHLFDVIANVSYTDRLMMVNKLTHGNKVLVPISHNWIRRDEIQKFHEMYIADGYEGSMLKNNTKAYEENKRSYNVIKKKDFFDAEFKVIGFQKEEFIESLGACILIDEEFDLTFKARPKTSHAQKDYIWTHQEEFVGRYATVRFQRRTDDNVPLFPRIIGFRDEADMPEVTTKVKKEKPVKAKKETKKADFNMSAVAKGKKREEVYLENHTGGSNKYYRMTDHGNGKWTAEYAGIGKTPSFKTYTHEEKDWDKMLAEKMKKGYR